MPVLPRIELAAIGPDGSTEAPTIDCPPEFGNVVAQTVSLYQKRGYSPPWIGYLAVEGDRCVGATGFVGPPADSEAELAYFTFPGQEGRGVATAMARALMARGRGESEETPAFVAHTLPAEGPSTSILRKLGFELIGATEHPEDGVVWKWRQAPR